MCVLECVLLISPCIPVRPGTLKNSRLCGAEELTCGASMSNFRQSPASSCLPPCTAVVYVITTALCSAMITAPRWYVVASTPSQSTSCHITTQQGAAMVQCMRTAELPGAGHLQATLGSCAKPCEIRSARQPGSRQAMYAWLWTTVVSFLAGCMISAELRQ